MKTLLRYMEANGMTNDRIELRRSYGGSPLNASDRKCVLTENEQTWPDCPIINYLLTYLARAVLGNIGTWSFFYGPR